MPSTVQLLDHGPLRPALAVALRLRIRQLYGVWVSVRYYDGTWIVRWPEVVVPMLEPVPTAPWDYEEAHGDVFFQEYRPKPGDVVVDLGAGMGSELDLMARLVGAGGRVLAVEADPRTFECLRLRIELNRIGNAVPVQAAVIDRGGTVAINTTGHHLEHHVLEADDGERVPATTLDQLAEAHSLDRIDFLKINIEGAEARALAGATESIGRVRNVAVSCHDYLGETTREQVEAFLSAHGFGIRPRRADDPRDWARSWIYGTRA